ncbi:taste receptor type 2 member 13-like [Scyliorhinus canicula]|uniref:taste receptor type 2 member 13-like n=1 Tax=Scyliorhinus canicula TaxID=7830 RepID=UPI0018F47F49|nr:taste receptor type 2 member 13-like [Scyliorhinus canicula]
MDELIVVSVVLLFSVFGLMINLFILITMMQQHKKGGLNPTQLIVSNLAVANIIAIIVVVARMAIEPVYIFCGAQQKIVDICHILSHSMNFWMSSFLCFFYCLKIVSVHRPSAMKLVQFISRRTGPLVASIFTLSCCLGALDCYLMNTGPSCYYQNGTYHFQEMNNSLSTLNYAEMADLDVYIDLILGAILPAFWMSISCFWIVFVLCKHRRPSQRLVTSVIHRKQDRHTRIISMIICLYLLFLFILFIRMLVLLCAIFNSPRCFYAMGELFLFSFLYDSFFYAIGNAIIVVFGICKLRDKMLHIFRMCPVPSQSDLAENGGDAAPTRPGLPGKGRLQNLKKESDP